MKRLAVVLLVTLAALVAAPSAQAAPPTHERVPIDETFTDESCGFPVQVQLTGFMLVIEWVMRMEPLADSRRSLKLGQPLPI
jgi:hypothetical protein